MDSVRATEPSERRASALRPAAAGLAPGNLTAAAGGTRATSVSATAAAHSAGNSVDGIGCRGVRENSSTAAVRDAGIQSNRIESQIFDSLSSGHFAGFSPCQGESCCGLCGKRHNCHQHATMLRAETGRNRARKDCEMGRVRHCVRLRCLCVPGCVCDVSVWLRAVPVSSLSVWPVAGWCSSHWESVKPPACCGCCSCLGRSCAYIHCLRGCMVI